MHYLIEPNSNRNGGNGDGPVNGRGILRDIHRRKLTESQRADGGGPLRAVQHADVRQSSSRKRRVSDRKRWQLREKLIKGLGKARIAAEMAHELGVDLDVWTDQSGTPRQLSPAFASCLNILTAQAEADLANLRND